MEEKNKDLKEIILGNLQQYLENHGKGEIHICLSHAESTEEQRIIFLKRLYELGFETCGPNSDRVFLALKNDHKDLLLRNIKSTSFYIRLIGRSYIYKLDSTSVDKHGLLLNVPFSVWRKLLEINEITDNSNTASGSWLDLQIKTSL